MTDGFKLKTIAAVATLAAAFTISANATLTMTISDGVDPDVVVTDGGSGDSTPSQPGNITWVGSLTLGGWYLDVNTASTKPVPGFGSATQPIMNMTYLASSTGAGTLTITFADDGAGGAGYGPLGVDSTTVALTANATSAQGTIATSATVNGDTTPTLTLSGPAPPSGVGGTVYGTANGLLASSWPMSLQTTITHTALGATTGDATVVVPEASTCFAGALLLLPFTVSTLRFRTLRFRRRNLAA